MKRDKTYNNCNTILEFSYLQNLYFNAFCRNTLKLQTQQCHFEPHYLGCYDKKNISAEGGKMVAKMRGDRVEKEKCIF